MSANLLQEKPTRPVLRYHGTLVFDVEIDQQLRDVLLYNTSVETGSFLRALSLFASSPQFYYRGLSALHREDIASSAARLDNGGNHDGGRFLMSKKSAIQVQCQNQKCRKQFKTIPSRLARGRGKYCSRACQFSLTPIERFWALVNKDGPLHPRLGTRCWEWQGSTDSNGYGRFGAASHSITSAHKFSWEMHYGSLPVVARRHDACVLHRCDNPACVNPGHLSWGTQKTNMQDCADKGRTNRPTGERNPAATIDVATAIEIRKLYGKRGKNGLTLSALSQKFNLSTSQIFRIVNNESWKEVT